MNWHEEGYVPRGYHQYGPALSDLLHHILLIVRATDEDKSVKNGGILQRLVGMLVLIRFGSAGSGCGDVCILKCVG